MNTPPPPSYDDAVRGLLEMFEQNPWFCKTYWPENEPRVRLMAQLAKTRFPDATGRAALDVGCFNGYITWLFSRLGFEMSAVDACADAQRDEMFRSRGITFRTSNLNAPVPLHDQPDARYDLVIMGEVFEHILNAPAELLRQVLRCLRPGGLLLLTTPNPSSLANVYRLLRDRYVLWGTDVFLRETKLDDRKVIDRGEVHYREYPAWVVRDLLAEVGYRVNPVRYYRTGVAPTHSFAKRWLKRALRVCGLSGVRLFSPGYVIAATKPE